MRKQREPETSILYLRENITTFIKDLNHIFNPEAKEEKDAPERQETNEETKGVHKPDKP